MKGKVRPNYKAYQEAESPAILAGVRMLTRRTPLLIALLIAGVAAAFGVHIRFPRYVSSSTIFVRSPANSLIQTLGGAGTTPTMPIVTTGTGSALDKYLNSFNTFQFARQMAASLLQQLSAPEADPEQKAQVMDYLFTGYLGPRTLSADPEKDSDKIAFIAGKFLKDTTTLEQAKDTIEVRGIAPSETVSVFLSNFVMMETAKAIVDYDTQELLDAQTYLEQQIVEQQTQLAELETSLIDFLRSNAGINAMTNAQNQLDTSSLQKSLNDSIISLKQNIAIVKNLRETERAGAKTQTPPSIIALLRQNTEALRLRKSKMGLIGIEEGSLPMKQIDEQIVEADKRLKEAEKNAGKSRENALPIPDASIDQTYSQTIDSLLAENRSLKARIDSIRAVIMQAEQDSTKAEEYKQRIDELTRKISFAYVLAENLRKKLVDIQIQTVSLQSKVKVIEPATGFAVKPRIPLPAKILVALVIALVIGITIAYMMEIFDSTVRSKHDLIELGLPILGTIPDANSKTLRYRIMNRLKAGANESPEDMAFKQIRSRLIDLRTKERGAAKTFCVLSAKPGEGKTYFAERIAKSLAKLGHPTILVDCDVRRSTLTDRLKVPRNNNGLTSYLEDGGSIDATVIPSILPNLDFIPSGGAVDDISEMMVSARFKAFVAELRTRYRYVVFDCPPVLPVVDGLSVAAQTDATVLISSFRFTKKGELAEAMLRLTHHVNENLFGMLNRTEDVSNYYYSHVYLAWTRDRAKGGGEQAANGGVSPQVTTSTRIERLKPRPALLTPVPPYGVDATGLNDFRPQEGSSAQESAAASQPAYHGNAALALQPVAVEEATAKTDFLTSPRKANTED